MENEKEFIVTSHSCGLYFFIELNGFKKETIKIIDSKEEAEKECEKMNAQFESWLENLDEEKRRKVEIARNERFKKPESKLVKDDF